MIASGAIAGQWPCYSGFALVQRSNDFLEPVFVFERCECRLLLNPCAVPKSIGGGRLQSIECLTLIAGISRCNGQRVPRIRSVAVDIGRDLPHSHGCC